MPIALSLHKRHVRAVPVSARYEDEQSKINPLHEGVTFPVLFVSRLRRSVYQKYVLSGVSPFAIPFLGLPIFASEVTFTAYHWVKGVLTSQATPTGTRRPRHIEDAEVSAPADVRKRLWT